MSGKLLKYAAVLGFLGLLCGALIFITHSDASTPAFNMLALVGLLLLSLSLLLFFISWISYIIKNIQAKKYKTALFIFLLGILIIAVSILRRL